MTNKFKVGDFVWCDFTDRLATIVAYSEKYDCYELNDGVMADEDDLEPLDKEKVKNQFLNELQCLLTKYNAKIDCSDYDTDGEWWYEKWLKIFIGNEEICWYDDGDHDKENLGRKPKESHFPLTPSNIFDYDK